MFCFIFNQFGSSWEVLKLFVMTFGSNSPYYVKLILAVRTETVAIIIISQLRMAEMLRVISVSFILRRE